MSEEYDQSKEGGQWGEGDGPNLRYDDFVGRIVQDPKEPPSVTLLSGYLGASSEEGYVRLYLDEELGRYVEIPEKAIRHTQELPPEQSPLGGSLVWIDQDAEVLHGAAGSERRKATFLEGQIAQDYIGGPGGYGTGGEGGYDAAGGITTQTRECGGGGIGIPPTETGPGCWQSVYQPCIPRTELPGCRTRTGILCTLIGPSCRTRFLPQCRSLYIPQCQSVAYPCVTVHEPRCVASGFVCNPIDFTIWQEQFDPQAGVAARRGGVGGFDQTFGVFQTGFNCPSVFDNCATQESFCPTLDATCPSQFVVCQSQFGDCTTRSGCVSRIVRCPSVSFNCPSVSFRCPTRGEPRCVASRTFICPDTQAGCQFESAACGFDPAGGGVVQQGQADIAAGPGVGGAVALPPTRFCPSRLTICPTQPILCRTRDPWRCPPTWYFICQPTQYNCPTLPNGCPGYTQFGSCETFGGCPSAVDACPTRFGCESQAGCYESVACQSQGCFPGGGGFEQGGGGGAAGGGGIAGGAGGGAAGAQGFKAEALAAYPPTNTPACSTQICWPGEYGAAAAIPQTRICPSQIDLCPTRYNCPSQFTRCPSVLVRCPSQVDACPTRLNCPSQYTPCQSQLIRCPSALDACPTRLNCPSVASPCITQDFSCETRGACPSAVDACPTRFGCYETQVCGGGFDPGGGGGGGGF
ncbi:MAG: hypothetical protein ABW208_09425 [Pyrinomonadaceae bacterium]